MHKILLLALAGLLLCACAENTPDSAEQTTNPISVTDFTGKTISLDKPAQRIVALAPHVVENIFSAGAGEKIVGVVEWSNYPPQAKTLPIVGGYEKTNHEKIVDLDPDLIIAWESGNSRSSVDRLAELGFTIYIDQPDSLSDVAKSIRDIGTLAGVQTIADTVADDYLEQLAKTRSSYANSSKVSAFYQVWNKPLQSINGKHIISDAIEICGGTNIYADEFAVAPIINIESVLERDPSAIIASGMSSGRPEWLDEWKKWPSLTAVQEDNLFFVNPDHLQRHTIRLLLGMKEVCRQLDLVRAKSN
jgi:iron complex transport system substrate-binding protein